MIENQPLFFLDRLTIFVRILILLLIVALITFVLSDTIPSIEVIKESVLSFRARLGWTSLVFGSIVYSIMLAIPFFPAVEFGCLLMAIFGHLGIITVYVFTLIGMNLAFFVGRSCPHKWSVKLFDVKRTQSQIDNLLNSSRFFQSKLAKKILTVPIIRALTIILFLNTPASALIGGGGAIGMISGMDRYFSWWDFFIIIAFGCLPLPVLFYFGIVVFNM